MAPSLIESMQELLDKETRVLELELLRKDKELYIMKEKFEQLQAQNRLDGIPDGGGAGGAGGGTMKSKSAAGPEPSLIMDVSY